MKTNNRTRTLVECAILVALSVVLSLIKIWEMPLGGSITLVSMLPVCVISIRHGLKWGLGSAFVFSLFQLFFGITMSGLLGWGLTPVMLIGCMLFDYLVAFTVLGFAGAFRSHGNGGVIGGIVLAIFLRFVSHFISGYVIFKNLDQWTLFGSVLENRPVLYSICYNGFYLLPEMIITIVVAAILMRIPAMRKSVG